MSKRRVLWAGLAVLLLIVGAFAWVMLTQVLGVIYLPSGSQQVGNFTIKTYRTEGFGHTGTRSTLYYRGRKLGERHSGLVPSPLDPERALYELYCEDYGKPAEDCGLFYFDGHTQRNYRLDADYKASLVKVYQEYAEESHHPWSSDGRFVIIQDQYKLLWVNLLTGEHSDLAERMHAQTSQEPQPPTRQVYFLGWSPDMSEAAVLLSTSLDDHPPEIHFLDDLYSLDLSSGALTYRCSVGPYEAARWWPIKNGNDYELRGTVIDYKWQKQNAAYQMEIWLKSVPGSGCTFREDRAGRITQ